MDRIQIWCIGVIMLLLFSGLKPAEWHMFELKGKAQGTTFHLIWYAPEARIDSLQLMKQFALLDQQFSRYKEGTAIDRFNQSAWGIRMDSSFQELIRQSFAANRETGGISDITVLPLIRFWQKGGYNSRELRKIRNCTGMQYLNIKGDSLIKTKPCIMIDLDGIAQGYTVDFIGQWLEQQGISNYMVEVGGELRTSGTRQPSGEPFRIAIEIPGDDNWSVSENSRMALPGNGALTTSGNYRKFIGTGMKLRSHIIDPRSGRPAASDLVSVTVYARSATLADAYDNALLVMGLKKALAFVDQHPEISAHFIYRNRLGQLKDTCTPTFPVVKASVTH